MSDSAKQVTLAATRCQLRRERQESGVTWPVLEPCSPEVEASDPSSARRLLRRWSAVTDVIWPVLEPCSSVAVRSQEGPAQVIGIQPGEHGSSAVFTDTS